MKRILGCAMLVAMAAVAGAGQVIKVPESWQKLAAKADQVTSINMDRNMLKFASKFMDNEGDEEGKRLVSKLNGIYVHSLQFKKAGAFTEADVAPIRAQLEGAEWSHMVDVVQSKPEKTRTEVYMKTVNGQTMGMIVLAEEPTELTFVQLDGPINPEDLDDLSGNFGVPRGIHVPPGKAGSGSANKPDAKQVTK